MRNVLDFDSVSQDVLRPVWNEANETHFVYGKIGSTAMDKSEETEWPTASISDRQYLKCLDRVPGPHLIPHHPMRLVQQLSPFERLGNGGREI